MRRLQAIGLKGSQVINAHRYYETARTYLFDDVPYDVECDLERELDRLGEILPDGLAQHIDSLLFEERLEHGLE